MTLPFSHLTFHMIERCINGGCSVLIGGPGFVHVGAVLTQSFMV